MLCVMHVCMYVYYHMGLCSCTYRLLGSFVALDTGDDLCLALGWLHVRDGDVQLLGDDAAVDQLVHHHAYRALCMYECMCLHKTNVLLVQRS